jgi:hypothetical protein
LYHLKRVVFYEIQDAKKTRSTRGSVSVLLLPTKRNTL